MNDKMDQMFDMDEVEFVMVANGEDLMDESATEEDMEVQEVEDEDDDYYDETIADIGRTFSMESIFVDEFREVRDCGMDTINEDTIDNSIMGIDPDVEYMEDDDDDDDYYDED